MVSGKEEAILGKSIVDTRVIGAYDDYFGGPYSSYGGFGGFNQDKKESGGVALRHCRVCNQARTTVLVLKQMGLRWRIC